VVEGSQPSRTREFGNLGCDLNADSQIAACGAHVVGVERSSKCFTPGGRRKFQAIQFESAPRALAFLCEFDAVSRMPRCIGFATPRAWLKGYRAR